MKSRVKIAIRGAVQGVGFRPFIFRLASEMDIKGFIRNDSTGVFIEGEENKQILDLFIERIRKEKPAMAFIAGFEYSFLDPLGYTNFRINESRRTDEISAFILPDIALCPDCLREMNDPNDRRYLYPFINCTNCGPRFSIIEALPYDRKSTTMKVFKMCDKCRKEYENPKDRRYHAQPIACPDCGPHVELWNSKGNKISKHNDAIRQAAELIIHGEIIAFKGIGGFQLIANAYDDSAVEKLRQRKLRVDKPFAIMAPDINSVKEICYVNTQEDMLLQSSESPIVLLKRKYSDGKVPSELVAPGNPELGVMLPYSPLHYLLMQYLYIPIIATSANISEEPMCIDEYEALERLSVIADYFLVHNRQIKRHVDDSVVRIVNGRVMVIRRARGYAPLPVEFGENGTTHKNDKKHILAVGGQLKNSIALKTGSNIFISQHVGDLSTQEANKAFERIINDFKLLYKSEPELIAADLHPDYYSTRYAKSFNGKCKTVQHHIAHIASCKAENHVKGDALGIAWDGTGYGIDGTVWGGEFFRCSDDSCIHAGSFLQFPLPGGEQAIKEPRRSALGMLYKMFGEFIFSNKFHLISGNFNSQEIKILKRMMEENFNCPLTSSVGRIFDGVASILNLKQKANYEGQAAMMLEFAANQNIKESYNFKLNGSKFLIVDWQAIVDGILNDLGNNISVSIISSKFHNTLVEIILSSAKYFGEEKIILSGGCFQNAFLLERTIKHLEENNFHVYWHQRVPTNDGGIALGQIAALKWEIGSTKDF